MNTLVVSVEQTGQRFEGHRTDDVCQLGCTEAVVPCQSTDRGHSAGAVGHAQTFLVNECFNRLDACFCHCFGSVHLNTLVNGSAFAQHRQGHVCQRSQVAGSTQRAFLRNDRNDTLIEHIHHHLHQQRTNAGHAAAQSVGTQQHHAADDLFGIWVAGSGAVAEDEVGGQGVGHLFGNSDAGKITKTGGDAVGNTFFAGDFFCQLAGTLHLSQRLFGDAYLCTKACNGNNNFMDDRWIQIHVTFTLFLKIKTVFFLLYR